MNEEDLPINEKIASIKNEKLRDYLFMCLTCEYELNSNLPSSVGETTELIKKATQRFENKIKACVQIENDLPNLLISAGDYPLLKGRLDTLMLKLALLYVNTAGEITDLNYNEIKFFIYKVLNLKDIKLKLKYFDLTIKLLEKAETVKAESHFNKEFIGALDLLKKFVTKKKYIPNEADLKYISDLDHGSNESDIRKSFYGIIHELDKKPLFQDLLKQLLEIIENKNNSPIIQFSIIFIKKCLDDAQMDASDLYQAIHIIHSVLIEYNKQIKPNTIFYRVARNKRIDLEKFEKALQEKILLSITDNLVNPNSQKQESEQVPLSLKEPDFAFFTTNVNNKKIKLKLHEAKVDYNQTFEKKITTDHSSINRIKEGLEKISSTTKKIIAKGKVITVGRVVNLGEFAETSSAVELGKEAKLPNQILFFKDASPEQFTNIPAIHKKKIKTRVIAFDEEGMGYDISSPYLYLKEINRLNDINLDIELPAKLKKKLLQEALFNEELERLEKIEVNQGEYVNKIERKIKIMEFELFASKEEKDVRQRNIEQKIENDKERKERQKISKLFIPKILSIQEKIEIYKKAFDSKSLSIEFSLFETSKNEFLVAFLRTIDYEKFQELIICSEYILNSIDNIRETFKKIDDFSEDLGVASNYIGILDSYYSKIKENFNRERIANFLENALILFKQRTLLLDNNYSLLEIQTKRNAIVFSEPNFLNEFISSNNNRKIYKILYNEIKQFLNKKNNTSLKIKKRKNKISLIKKLFYYFFEKYYFVDEKSKEKLIKKFFSNIPSPSSLESIKNIMDTLKWWDFFSIGINLICILKKGFKARLSEELFLGSLEEIFKKIDTEQGPNLKNIDMLYDLRKRINSSAFKIHDDSINLNSLNILDSRQAIVNRLKKLIKMEGALFDNVQILSGQASRCINEFNNLNFVCRKEIEKASEKNEIFQFNKNDVSKLHFPLKWMR